MGRHKKIPTKNRKKLKACDPFNTKITSWKLQDAKKKNWVPKSTELEDQPLTQNLRGLQESMKQSTSAVTLPKKKRSAKNKAVLAGEKMGIYKRRFEDMKSYVKRVESATYRAIEEHRIKLEQGTAGRAQSELEQDFKILEDKEKVQKEQKKREIQNQIARAKKEREIEAKRIEDKMKAKKERQMKRKADTESSTVFENPEGEQETTETVTEDDQNANNEKDRKEVNKFIKKEKKTPVFGVPKLPPVNEDIINKKEKITFGERYDAPPKFSGALKDKLDPLTAKAGGKNLLLHSILKKSTDEGATYLEKSNKRSNYSELERLRVVEAYRELKKKKSTGFSM